MSGPGELSTTAAREALLERCLAALATKGAWLTLTGMPGVGKSFLAARLTSEGLRLGWPLRRARGAEGLRALLEASDGLLLLEELALPEDPLRWADAARDALARGARVLCTALGPTGSPGETVLRLEPLALPAEDAAPEEILEAESVRFLLALLARRGVVLSDPAAQAAELAGLARAASGLPLALQRVAEHAVVAPLSVVREVLARPSRFGGRVELGEPARHATLGECFEPLFASLSPEAGALLVRAAPHRKGWELGDPQRELGAARELQELGLLLRAGAEEGALRLRFRVPELAARLALERAAEAEVEAAHREHRAALSREARAASAALVARGDRRAVERLASLRADVEQALRRAEGVTPEGEDLEALVRASVAVLRSTQTDVPGRYLERLEALVERSAGERTGARLLHAMEKTQRLSRAEDAVVALEALQVVTEGASALVRAEFAHTLGLLHSGARSYERGLECFVLAAAGPDPLLRARALLNQGIAAVWLERYEEAERHYVRALEVTLALRDSPRLEAIALSNLCLVRAGLWRSERSATPRTAWLAEGVRAVELFRACEEPFNCAVGLVHVGIAATTMLRFEEARAAFTEALESAGHNPRRAQAAMASANLGDLAVALGDFAAAQPHFDHARAYAEEGGDRYLLGVVQASEADAAWEQGHLERARDGFGRALETLREQDQHASRRSVLLAQRAFLGPEREAGAGLEEALSLAGQGPTQQRHAVALYAACAAQRAGTLTVQERERVVEPWVRALFALQSAEPSRRGAEGYGMPWMVWLAARRFVRLLGAEQRRELFTKALGLEARGARGLLVDLDARCVRTLDGAWEDFSKRPKPFALFGVLACAAAEGKPGHVYRSWELVERVWPDEKMLPEAGANRVYAAVSLLRKARGLRDLVVHQGDGYGLAPGVEVWLWHDRYAPLSRAP